MSDEINHTILTDIIASIRHFSSRPVVQQQIMMLLLIIIGSWGITTLGRFIWGRLNHRNSAGQESMQGRALYRYACVIIGQILFPAMVLIALTFTKQYLVLQGWYVGLFDSFSTFFEAMLVYRLLIGLVNSRLGLKERRRYHYRFLAPLFTIFAFGWLINDTIPIHHVAAIKLWDGLTSPVTIGSVLITTVGFYFWYDGSSVLKDMLYSTLVKHTSSDPGVVKAILSIGQYIFIAIGLMIGFRLLGFDATVLAFVTGGLSVGIGFGLKEILSNLVSGILLLFDQSLRPGDIISVNDEIGVVKTLGIRATTVNTLNNVEVVIPNQTFLNASVTTYTKSDRFVRAKLGVETADAHAPNMVRQALLTVAGQHPMVSQEPAPTVFFEGNGDTSHKFQLAIWYNDPLATEQITSELYYLIFDEFAKHGIDPSTPQRDLALLRMPSIEMGPPYHAEADPNGSPPAHRWH